MYVRFYLSETLISFWMSQKSRTIHQCEAQSYGIDLKLLDVTLARTPSERVLAHQQALELMELLQQAGRDARIKKTPRTASRTSS